MKIINFEPDFDLMESIKSKTQNILSHIKFYDIFAISIRYFLTNTFNKIYTFNNIYLSLQFLNLIYYTINSIMSIDFIKKFYKIFLVGGKCVRLLQYGHKRSSNR